MKVQLLPILLSAVLFSYGCDDESVSSNLQDTDNPDMSCEGEDCHAEKPCEGEECNEEKPCEGEECEDPCFGEECQTGDVDPTIEDDDEGNSDKPVTGDPDSEDDDEDENHGDDEDLDEPCQNPKDCKEVCDVCESDSLQCDGTSLMICQKNDKGCLDWVLKQDCSESSMMCDDESLSCVACEDSCQVGEKKCSDKDILECTENAGGCPSWEIIKTCEKTEKCDDSKLSCVAGCKDECKANETKCGDTGILTCKKASSGCLAWEETETCEFGKICLNDKKPKCDYACGNDCDPFSIVILPDTQNYTRTTTGIYKSQTEWIAKNKGKDKKNIRFVLHMGDVANNNLNEQYKKAIEAHDVLAKAGIPYSIATGNHEYIKTKDKPSVKYTYRGTTLFGKHFNNDYIKNGYKDSSWFHGFKSTGSMYATFSVGNLKFLVLALEFSPRKEILCWAENIIKKHKDHYVIITTHGYLGRGATEAKAGKKYTGNDHPMPGATGLEVFNELVARHSNVIIAAGGHVFGIEQRNVKGNAGNSVHETLVDYQAEPYTNSCPSKAYCGHDLDAGNGWLRVLTIDPKNTKDSKGNIKPNVTATSIRVLNDDNKTCNTLYCSTSTDKVKKCGEENNPVACNYYDPKNTDPDHKYTFTIDFSKPIKYSYNTKNKLAFTEIGVNSTLTGDQVYSSVAMNRKTGAYVAVWQDNSDESAKTNDGTGNYDIAGRIFCAGGCQDKAQFVVNANTNGQQRHPDVAMDTDGNFVVVWEDDNDGNGTYQILMRGFDAEGKERFNKTVNSVAKGQQYTPAIAMNAKGDFVVAWRDQSVSKSTPQVYIRGFNADGSEKFHDRNVMASVEGKRILPDVAMADDGSFVVTWQDDTNADGKNDILAKVFNADGSDKIAHFTVNSKSTGDHINPSVGMNETGDFYITYEDDSDGNGAYLTKARGYNASGKQIYKDTTLAKAGEKVADPVVCVDKSGSAYFAWKGLVTKKDSNDKVEYKAYGIYRRILKNDKGTLTLGDASRVSRWLSETTEHVSPSIACSEKGYQVYSYTYQSKQNKEIYARGID